MRVQVSRGFTIIETMLVLAITGVLIGSLLVGVGSSITNQRYRDSVVSLKSLLQDQYSQTAYVSNDRNANWSCNNATGPVQGGATVAAGQSKCVLLGRYIGISDTAISTATVVGYETSTTPQTSDVLELSNNYSLTISSTSIESNQLEWGARIAWAKTGPSYDKVGATTAPRSIAILIVRSPSSGTTYTFTSNSVTVINSITPTTLKAMLVASTSTVPGQASRVICVDPTASNNAGITFPTVVPEKLAVYISATTQDGTGIESRSDSTETSLVSGADINAGLVGKCN